MGSLLQDLRYGVRMLSTNPSFTFVAVLTVALGIGANTAIFSVVNALLLRPLAGVRDPGRVVMIYTSDFSSSRYSTSSYPDYVDLRDQNESFSDVAAFADNQAFHHLKAIVRAGSGAINMQPPRHYAHPLVGCCNHLGALLGEAESAGHARGGRSFRYVAFAALPENHCEET